MEPRVLLLAYHFPPVGGAGAQRAVKLVRHLADAGYEPVVVTCPGDLDGRYNPTDAGLVAELPPDLEIHRIAGPEPELSSGWLSRAERLAAAIDGRTRWWMRGALETGRRVPGPIDLIHAFLEPYETAHAASALARHFGVPWIADLQDPWALDEVRVQISALHLRKDRRRMRRGLSSAAAIVMNTPDAAHALTEELPEMRRRPVYSIPNGFDAREWTGPAPRRDDGKFRIVHTGTLHTHLGLTHRRQARLRRVLGGQVAPVDMLTRSHVFLLEAIDRLIAAEPALAERVEVQLAGVLTPTDREVADRYPFVRVLGFLPHAETVQVIRSADLLFLPMHGLPAGRRARIVPCKTYEYLASGRPILAAVPDGDARDLLAGRHDVQLCRPADVDAMQQILARAIAGPASAPATAPRDGLERFERGALAEQLVEVFDHVLAARAGSGRERGRPMTAASASIQPRPES